MNEYYMKMGDASEDEVTAMLEEVGTIQDILEHNDFYIIDNKVEEAARGLGLADIGLDRKVDELSEGKDKSSAHKTSFRKTGHPAFRRAYKLS